MRRKIRGHARRVKVIIYQETLFDYKEHFWTFVGPFIGIGLIGLLSRYVFGPSDTLLLVGSFGASSVLIHGLINSPLPVR